MRRAIVMSLALLMSAPVVAQTTPGAAPPSQPADARPFALMVGDKAPPLSIDTWVKGAPVTGFEKGKVYVVEFWATWCGPCIASMPHISELQAKFAKEGLTIIGVTSEDPNNSLEKVKAMVEAKGDTMGYTVAWDKGRETNGAYMKAAGQNGIPCSYVVDRNGYIAYIGHPMTMDETLAKVVAGTHDLAANAKAYAEARKSEAKRAEAAREAGERVRSMTRDLSSGDPEAIAKRIDRLAADDATVAGGAVVREYQRLMGAKSYTEAYALGWGVLGSRLGEEPQILNLIAWLIVDPEATPDQQDILLAYEAARRADAQTDHKDPAIVDTLAKVFWDAGNRAQAMSLQKKAVELSKGTSFEVELSERLEWYQEVMAKKGSR